MAVTVGLPIFLGSGSVAIARPIVRRRRNGSTMQPVPQPEDAQLLFLSSLSSDPSERCRKKRAPQIDRIPSFPRKRLMMLMLSPVPEMRTDYWPDPSLRLGVRLFFSCYECVCVCV
ncbi:hypothetical protein BO82DRAFT_6239 [Aspergillus uvarum CBS 121591]|uniref:Uncharacterized protein n=1 Tax=Aspergillus uvarum CBS 121591 TaxID=1448315 RepID=A0A319D8D6_9EURO|nr:hypothetical protein BO82DRAFT_6239 [Aspergillus uvarum CBS 121591]PYH87263.1 hypothetical protein BO82DRAFT_6239 [Aspergillus uvarum CBS 121591]